MLPPPITHSQEVPPEGHSPPPELASASLDILVVDDAEANLMAMEAMLADLDARLVKARSGPEALRCLLQQDFALVLLDVRMPGMDGFETAELIRARGRSRRTPIMFLTAFDRTREQEVRGYALGAVDFLSKPIVPEVLRGKVSVLIELHRKTEEIRRQAALLQRAERREHAQRLEQAHRRWEEEGLRKQMEREHQAAEALQRSNERLQILSDVASELLLLGDEPWAVAGRLLPRVADHLGFEVALVHRAEEGGEVLVLGSHAGLDGAPRSGIERVRVGELAFGRAAATSRPVLSDGVRPLDPVVPSELGLTALACYPLAAGGRLHGTAAFGSARRAAFAPDELAVMELVCGQIAAALERARLVDELRRSAEGLRAADERKDQFLAMLGHELRNPLAPVLNAVKLIQRMGAPTPLLQRVMAAADRQLAHMTRLLDDLLDVSRIRNGKIELRRQALDLRDLVRDAVQVTEALLAARSHELDVSLPGEPLPVDGDPARLAQVFANLLNNAAKYTDRGGHLRLSARRDGEVLTVAVQDDGIGISPEMLPRIFDMFVQADQASDRALGGLGLGLTLVRTLVELHGGTIHAESRGLGHGSAFVVRLPATAELVEPRTPPDVAANTPPLVERGRPADIVVVEDNGDIRDSLKALLELRGHTVHEAENGRAGVELIRDRAPRVALVDIGLPGLDGYQVARELRSAPLPTRLVAMTGYGRPEDRQRALEAGFDAHLVKPVDFDELSRLLDRLS